MNKAELFKVRSLDIEDHEEFLQIVKKSLTMNDRPDQIWAGHRMLPSAINRVSLAYHLADDNKHAHNYASHVVLAAKAYFFGGWRTKVPTDDKKIDPKWWRDKESWIDNFRYAICWAMVLSDWKSVEELAAYPDHGRSMEANDSDQKPARREWLIALAQFIRGEKVKDVTKEVEKLPGADWRGTMDLARGLDAVIAKDAKAASEHLNAFLKAHHKRKKGSDITDTITIEGTILYYLARHEGLGVEVDAKLRPYLIELSV